MSGRLYRVVEPLPWIEGGSPAPEGQLAWEGGKDVLHQPGDTVYIDDREVSGVYHKLEALDDTGRALLREARARAEAPAQTFFPSPSDAELLTRALDEKRRVYGCRIEDDYAVSRDGTRTLISSRFVPSNRLRGVVYGDDGLPRPYDTALQRKQIEKDSELAAIHRGASRGGKRGRDTRRDEAARRNEALLAAVRAYREEHPDHGRPAIATALLPEHGRTVDHADPQDRARAISALTKRIERLEKKLDT